MQKTIIGRKNETAILEEALRSDEAEMVAIVGRRRIGKTFLVTNCYQKQMAFEMSGSQGARVQQQLRNFRDELKIAYKSTLPLEIPDDWLAAFQMLRQYLSGLQSDEKKVVFFDEIPWLAGSKSGFLEALAYFWNTWASRQPLVLVICGSAASWMIRKIVHDKGGLHNRITRYIYLQPFTLAETEAFLHAKGVFFDRFQCIQLYMALGGVPQYLKAVKPGKSAAQNIDQICFSSEGALRDEFSKLYQALFNQADRHIDIIRALGSKWKGMDRTELLEKIGLKTGGGLSALLEELEQSGFITSYYPPGKKKRDKVFRLSDPYSLFYLHFIEPNTQEQDAWMQLSQSQKYKSWSGYAFENVCLGHIPQIKKAMGIGAVYTESSVFYKQGAADSAGAQIDLVLARKDRITNLFEIKFYDEPFVPTPAFAEALRSKKSVFRAATASKQQLSWVLMAPYGLRHNQYSIGLVEVVLSMDDLFG